MDAFLPLSHSRLERSLADLCGASLSCESVPAVRAMIMERMVAWFSLDQALWVHEPRSLAMPPPGGASFLYIRHLPSPELFAPMMSFRAENRFLRQMVAQREAGVLRSQDLGNRRDWQQNAFHHEVCVPMGLRHMMAVEIAEGAESDDVLAPVMGRESRAFTLAESRWLARIHWALKPVLMHLRERNGLLNWVKAQRHSVQDLLTAREQEVYHWMGLGKRNKEIAKIIGCAPRTVEKHIENILSKTSAETRTAATLGKLSPNCPAP